jgi:drug/metabolite transporter (DMT)-like permease
MGKVEGDLYAVLGGAFAAGYLMLGRYARPGTSWLRYVGTVYPIAAAFLLAAALVAGDAWTGYSTKTYTMIALLALGPQLIGHSAINWSLGYLPVMIVAMAILAEPVGSTILATIILDERPTVVEGAGAALVLVGVYLALRGGTPQEVEEQIEGVEVAVAD